LKKLAIGCLVLVVLFLVVGGGAMYWTYRKVSTVVSSTVEQFKELSSVPTLEAEVRNTSAFTAPESGELTADQVQRLVQVQDAVRQRLGARFATLNEKYKALIEKKEATALDLPQLMAAYRDLTSSWMEAKRAQVDALNRAHFSLAEYRWVRSCAYAAVGVPFLDVDVSKVVDAIKSGHTTIQQPASLGGGIGPSGPEHNQKIIEPFKKQLEDNVALASFGL
jgi:hypothetical protein